MIINSVINGERVNRILLENMDGSFGLLGEHYPEECYDKPSEDGNYYHIESVWNALLSVKIKEAISSTLDKKIKEIQKDFTQKEVESFATQEMYSILLIEHNSLTAKKRLEAFALQRNKNETALELAAKIMNYADLMSQGIFGAIAEKQIAEDILKS